MSTTATPATTVTVNEVYIVTASPATTVNATGQAIAPALPLTEIPATGKVYVRYAGVAVMLFGIAELVASSCVTHNSSGYYVGGLYVGIIGILTGSLALNPISIESLNGMGWMVVYSSIDLLIAFIGLAVTSANYNFVDSLEACANYSSTLTTSCGTSAYANCYGDSSYYAAARGCELTYIADNYNDLSSHYCTCVTESVSDDATCYNYDYMRSCSSFLDLVPHQLSVAVSFLVLQNVAFIALFICAYLSRYHPDKVMTSQERAEGGTLRSGLLVGQVSSSTATPATVV